MLQQIDKKKKLFTYLFFLLLLTTINNLSLSNSEYLNLKIKQIKVSGLNNENNLINLLHRKWGISPLFYYLK